MNFAFQAVRDNGELIADRIEASSSRDAIGALRDRGLTVVRLTQSGDAEGAERGPATERPRDGSWLAGRRVGQRDLLLFMRQMKMLLESGAPLVEALTAVERQCTGQGLRDVLHDIRDKVERGGSLSAAFLDRPDVFRPVQRSMIAAGEAAAALPEAFRRLSDMAVQQQTTRRAVVGALAYPAVLLALSLITCVILMCFVIPRFAGLFESLNTPLPLTTQLAFGASAILIAHWPLILAGLGGATVALCILARTARLRAVLDEVLLATPIVGRLAQRLILARILRIWAATLRARVPLIDALQHSHGATANAAFRQLVANVITSVEGGGQISQALSLSRLVDPIVAAAIATGEQHGRLVESVEFVADWMDEENIAAISTVARLAEPIFLSLIGLVVGFVATALFIPLFDLATAGGS